MPTSWWHAVLSDKHTVMTNQRVDEPSIDVDR